MSDSFEASSAAPENVAYRIKYLLQHKCRRYLFSGNEFLTDVCFRTGLSSQAKTCLQGIDMDNENGHPSPKDIEIYEKCAKNAQIESSIQNAEKNSQLALPYMSQLAKSLPFAQQATREQTLNKAKACCVKEEEEARKCLASKSEDACYKQVVDAYLCKTARTCSKEIETCANGAPLTGAMLNSCMNTTPVVMCAERTTEIELVADLRPEMEKYLAMDEFDGSSKSLNEKVLNERLSPCNQYLVAMNTCLKEKKSAFLCVKQTIGTGVCSASRVCTKQMRACMSKPNASLYDCLGDDMVNACMENVDSHLKE